VKPGGLNDDAPILVTVAAWPVFMLLVVSRLVRPEFLDVIEIVATEA
jgi:hypothetical protein